MYRVFALPTELKKQLIAYLFTPFILNDATFHLIADSKRMRIYALLNEFGDITLEDITQFVHRQLMEEGEKLYYLHIKTRIYPDHLPSPQTFGYWLAHGGYEALPFFDRHKIHFDHNETRAQYEEENKDLLGKVVAQLTNALKEYTARATTL